MNLSRRSEDLLSYFTGLAPVGQPFIAPRRQVADALDRPEGEVRFDIWRLKNLGFIRPASSKELAGGRGYVVLKRLETRA